MERTADVKDRIEGLGDDFRERASRAAGREKEGIVKTWDDAVSLMKRYPGRALGLAAVTGAVAGVFLTRMATPERSEAEKKVHKWVHNAQDGWDEFRGGLDQILTIVRGAVNRLK